MIRRRLAIVFVLFVVVVAPLSAVFGNPGSSNTSTSTSPKTEINVLAASSLSSAFTSIADEFSRAQQTITVTLSFAGSSTLATQIEEGAPVDVVAFADTTNMDRVTSTGDVSPASVTTFAKNRLAILTARDNPRAITTVRDLTRDDLTLVLCDVSQPCGRYASELFARAGLRVNPSSRESSVAGVVSRIRTGEADAGIGYASDVVANSDISGVDIPEADNVVASYPVGLATRPSSGSTDGGKLFIDFLMSDRGQTMLTSFGFDRVK